MFKSIISQNNIFSSFFVLLKSAKFEKLKTMIIDTEIKNSAENIKKRAGYLWRFL